MKLLFNEKTLPLIMEALELKTTMNGFVIDKDEKFVIDASGLTFKPEELIGIYNQSYITKERQLLNFVSIQVNKTS